ncbi:hypothetical protein [Polynucleobacter sp. es-MAR-4]|uniref:hypothetical protein n=1 Tax=Polynucleobacter sp. es-MAR-4 TaxID=1855655 RepID=UPI001C0E6CF6|nr:hypothetical protein [Polynucleobacter sp. es-MAR-4]MBU3637566.1 hypothetical protein [Polynucleobacter sp. es-MAR-4]
MFYKITSFCIPAFIFLEIEYIGRVFISDILVIAVFPFILWSFRNYPLNKIFLKVLLFSCLWLICQALSDLINLSNVNDLLRGNFKIILFIFYFIVFYFLIVADKINSIILLCGLIFGLFLSFLFSPNQFAINGDYWKFGVGYASTLAIFLFISVYKFPYTSLIYIILAFVNIYLGYRSLALVCLACSVYQISLKYNFIKFQFNIKNIIKLVFLLISIFISAASYNYLASSGYLGFEQQFKYQFQTTGKYGPLIGARPELLGSIHAILDEPVLGHGSWARNVKYKELLKEEVVTAGYGDHGITEDDLIPSHSYLFGAWVESGVMGAIFWLYIVFLIFRGFRINRFAPDSYCSLYPFLATWLLWNILFSPFGAEARIYASLSIALLILYPKLYKLK